MTEEKPLSEKKPFNYIKTNERYDEKEKVLYQTWTKEKPLSEKTFKLGVGIGNQTKVFDNMFKREDVAHAVERLKNTFEKGINHILNRTDLDKIIDRIFGDLNYNTLNFNSKGSLINDLAS